MVVKRCGPRIDALRERLGADLVDEHIAVVGPRNSGKSFLAMALAVRFHDGGRGNSVDIFALHGRSPVLVEHLRGSPEQHTIRIYDGYLPEAPYLNALRCISTDPLG